MNKKLSPASSNTEAKDKAPTNNLSTLKEPDIAFKASDLVDTSVVVEEVLKDSVLVVPPLAPWVDKNLALLHTPQIVGYVYGEHKASFSKNHHLHLEGYQIKDGGDTYRVPQVLAPYEFLIRQIALYEKRFANPMDADCICSVTIHQDEVIKGTPLNQLGHAQPQSEASIDREMESRSYIVYDAMPLLFYNQKFQIGDNWDKSMHDYAAGFRRQIDPEKRIYCDPYIILRVNGYCMYEEPIAHKDALRTVFKMTYRKKLQKNDKLKTLSPPPDIPVVIMESVVVLPKEKKCLPKK